MAIRLDQFYGRFRAKSIYKVLGVQLLVGALTLGVVYGLALVSGLTMLWLFGIAWAIFVLLQIAATPFIVDIISEPTKLMVQAVTHISRQANNVTPPLINQTRHERSGLKMVIQTIYEVAVGSSHEIDVTAGNNTGLASNVTFLQQLLGEVPCGIIALNKDRAVIYANQLAPVRVTPKQEQEVELVFEQSNSLHSWLDECEKSKVKDTKTWTRIENKAPDEPGRKIFDIIAYYQKEGSVAETLLVAVDRTADYAPDQEDMDFIALAAHELRGPITVIRGYLDVLNTELGDKLVPEQKELFDRLGVSANRLSSYVNNILNVSRYDRRHLKLHLHEESLDTIFQTIVDDVALRAHTQNRVLSIHIPPELPAVAADRNSLSEVITNLIDNAIKYSSEGGQVIVKAEVKGNFVEVGVQDFGIGIPPTVMQHLFSKFYRSHKSRQTVSGTGLGLYLSKAIIESHGGQIWARSTEGQGSTFGFTIPIYSTVADKLLAGDNSNKEIIESSNGWIKNHSMYRG